MVETLSVAIRECSFLGAPGRQVGTRSVSRDPAPNVDAVYVADDIVVRIFISWTIYPTNQATCMETVGLASESQDSCQRLNHQPETSPPTDWRE